MEPSLFSEFNAVSAKQWKQKIQADLKGANFNDTLVWQSLEGVAIKPFYHKDDLTKIPLTIPGQPDQWHIIQKIFIDNEAIVNKLILNSVQNGAQGIVLEAHKPFNIDSVFKDFNFKNTTIYFNLTFLDETFYESLIPYLKNKQATVFYQIDIINNLNKDGNWYFNLEKDHQVLDHLYQKYQDTNLVAVNLGTYQNAGANIIQQLAYSIAHANEYLNHFKAHQKINLNFQVSVGSNYFFEIAKIRALRLLYANLATAYGFATNCHILATPTLRNKTIYDYNVNMLRTSTECMSAILGGADAIVNLPYDALYHKSNDFGERIARNQLLILKNESYFEAVSNPAQGSYYIESCTLQFAEKAWQLFKEIEAKGGYLKQLKAGVIQKKIKESAQKEQQLFNENKLILVGTNKYQNSNDNMKDELQLYPFLKTNPRKTLIEPLTAVRLAETSEKNRLENEKK